MKPVLLELFGLKIYGYGLMEAIGILTGLFLLINRAKKRGYDEDSILNMAIVAVISGLLGGKLMYIITDFKNILESPEILKNIGNGFVVYGAIIGGILGVYFYSKHKKWDILRIFDMTIPSLAIGQGFGRIGCFLAGCCYGRETTSAIGVEFHNSLYAPAGVKLIPTQLFSSAFDFALALFLIWLDGKQAKKGRVFGTYLIAYSVGRFIIEFFRNDPRGSVGVLSTSQFISIFTVVVGVLIFNLWKVLPKERQEK